MHSLGGRIHLRKSNRLVKQAADGTTGQVYAISSPHYPRLEVANFGHLVLPKMFRMTPCTWLKSTLGLHHRSSCLVSGIVCLGVLPPPTSFYHTLMLIDFDTGSSDLWVWSTELSHSTQTQGKNHSIYDPKASSTYQNVTGSSWDISYGDGSSASGTVGLDKVTIGGLTILNQGVELAKTLSPEFAQDTSDGLLGLAFSNINTVTPTPLKTPVDNMIAQHDIPANMSLFTAKLGSYLDAKEPDKGESFYTFGFIDQNTIRASGQQPVYTPVDSSSGKSIYHLLLESSRLATETT